MKNLARTCLAASVLLALSARSGLAAQPVQSRAQASHPFEVAIEAQLGYFQMAASDSATATFGSADALSFGGAARATVWRGAFVSIAVRTFAKEGERVFVAAPGSPVQKLGHPLGMRTTTGFVSVGYRFRQGRLIVPYLSAGLAVAAYSEDSEVAGEPFDVDRTKAGFVGAGGVEIGRGLLRLGAEVGYTTVPDTIGTAGVSKVYGETDGGGFHALGKVILAFGI